ncbi:MAG TPA: hypothetical protein VMV82_00240 [Candidatus Dormibacteraeota bacterium]|nr:hypothetical protein [Candidatus Dormibacteraeota bacterium]
MQRTLGFITGAVGAAILLAGCGKTYPVGAIAPTAPPIKPSVTSVYTLPTPPASALPQGIASAPSVSNCAAGVIWFTEQSNNSIGTLNQAAKFTTLQLPNAGSQPYGITCGPDGQIWFTEYAGNRIGRYDTSTGNFAEFSIPTSSAQATSIVLGADGGLWFTESGTGKMGRADAQTGAITEYATGGTTPLDAAEGSDGSVWFTLEGSNQVGSITTGGGVTLHNVSAASQPFAIIAGSDHALWFTEHASGKLGRIVPSNGALTEVALTGCASPGALEQGTDGNFYVLCSGGSPVVVQYNPQTTKQKSFALKSGSVPQEAVIGFDNKLYFTDSGLNALDQFTYQ